jgi:hypothetical protein
MELLGGGPLFGLQGLGCVPFWRVLRLLICIHSIKIKEHWERALDQHDMFPNFDQVFGPILVVQSSAFARRVIAHLHPPPSTPAQEHTLLVIRGHFLAWTIESARN